MIYNIVMRWLKSLTSGIPHWGFIVIALLDIFVVLALGLPRLVKLALVLSPPAVSTSTKTNRAPGSLPNPAPAYPPGCTAVGQQWTSPADGMILVCVPAGNFLMGSSDEDQDAAANEKPQHTVFLEAFWIDKTDVTNGEYALCVASGGCPLPMSTISYNHEAYFGTPTFQNFPVTNVTWQQASQYCAWAYRHLPSEAEWEKVARGTDGSLYPWGNSAPDRYFLNFNSSLGDTSAVCQYPDGNSAYDACDMAGNVWQWVGDWYDDNGYATAPAFNPNGPLTGIYKVFRGSQWGSPAWAVRSAIRRWRLPNQWSYNLGFRCAAPAP
ncbi:MAG: formylglycine-generating enzyme family protein [Anaerolineales bacterium]